ncbi:hypothetical protein HPB50_003517 [Hyalomma asiaticum]|uniref:Uncharacterized protein n=1 Tax=Hyalomma asiaticum TaxID=266040 RepID=A0ACB7RRL9_HYAAI|nr:hypothetical protein HPB50_003517 [Hyalomma asiaticum]
MAEQKKRSGSRSTRKPSSAWKSSTSSKTSTSVKSKESAEKKERHKLHASSATGGTVAVPSPAPKPSLSEQGTPVVPLAPVGTAEPRRQEKQPVKKAVTIEEQAAEAIAAGVAPAKATDVQYRGMVIVPLVVLSTLLLIILVPLLWYLMSWDPAAPKHIALCRTPDCAQFGREVSAAIDPTIHPCHDFHGFVCGGSDQPKHRQSTESRMIADAYDMALKEVKADVKRVGKVTQFFRSCIRAGTHKKENLRQFAELRRNLSLSWPEMKPTGAHPLEVMVNLALNWQMNFLFDMDVATVRQFPAILFTRGQLDYGWQQRERDPPNLEYYEDYVDTYYGILDVNVSRIDIKASELLTIERAIVHAKIALMYDAPQQEWFKLRALDEKTSSLPSGPLAQCPQKARQAVQLEKR